MTQPSNYEVWTVSIYCLEIGEARLSESGVVVCESGCAVAGGNVYVDRPDASVNVQPAEQGLNDWNLTD